MQIITNSLRNLPHREGQTVVRVRDGADEWEIEAHYHGASYGYGVYLFAVRNEVASWTRGTRQAATAIGAREVAWGLVREFFGEKG